MLRPGVEITLPSGNVVRLLSLDGGDWLCIYVAGTRRGEVVLSSGLLTKGTVCVNVTGAALPQGVRVE